MTREEGRKGRVKRKKTRKSESKRIRGQIDIPPAPNILGAGLAVQRFPPHLPGTLLTLPQDPAFLLGSGK